MHPGQLKAQDPLGAVCSDPRQDLSLLWDSVSSWNLMQGLRWKTSKGPPTSHKLNNSLIPCSMVGRLNSRLSVLGRQHWECKGDHWWGRLMKKSQIKLPIVLTATTMGRIILSWAWNQVTFLLTDPINCYCVRGCGQCTHHCAHLEGMLYNGARTARWLSGQSCLLSNWLS